MTTEETLRQRITELEAECKQLRETMTAKREAWEEILQAVANARWGTYPSGEHLFGMGDALALRLKARKLLGME